MIKDPNTNSPSASLSSVEALCGNLIDGMHAASQPLTILRASLGSPDVARQSVEELRKLLRQSSREVERLCVLFNYLQQFVVVESIKAEPEIQDLPSILSHALEGVDLLFDEAGIALTYRQTAEATPYVLVDSSRLEQALNGILLVVLSRAESGDEVLVQTRTPGDFVEILVESAIASPADMVTEARLRLALAAANLRSQSANMTWSDRPFAVQITLPVANTPISA
jgi:hypothetical protein